VLHHYETDLKPHTIIILIVLLDLLLSIGNAIGIESRADSLINSVRLAKEDSNKVKTLGLLVNEFRFNDAEKALYYAKEELRLAQKINWPKGIANAYNSMGLVMAMLSSEDVALEYYFKSLKISETLNDKKAVAYMYDNIGGVYSAIGNYNKALEYRNLSLNIKQALGDERRMGGSYVNIGALYSTQSNYKQALEYLLKALKIGEKYKNTQRIILCNLNIGDTYKSLKDYNKALEYTFNALALAERNNNDFYTAAAEVNIGEVYGLQQNFSNALAHLQKGLATAKKVKSSEIERNASYTMYQTYTMMGDYKQALEYFKNYEVVKEKTNGEEAAARIANLEARYKNEKAQQKMELLSKENEIQALKISSKNYWIAGLAGIIVAIVIITFYVVRNKVLKDDKRVLLLEQKTSELEQKALRAQINPHFLFNALNSIQKFIVSGDQDNAHEYISKFSLLMRKILDNSEYAYVTIEEEMSAVRLYLEIEKLRVKNKFSFAINIAPEIDSYNVHMPAMLIQPYVENAIWHGIMNKEGAGHVQIDIETKNGTILFTVSDNGIGRVKAAELRKESSTIHKSAGLKLVKDRIDSINARRETKIEVSINDKLTKQETANGTEVKISMPVEA